MNTVKGPGVVVATMVAMMVTAGAAFAYVEPPSLVDAVKAGSLPRSTSGCRRRHTSSTLRRWEGSQVSTAECSER